VSETPYDIAIIGAGPGGYQAAIRAAQFGAKVALIERNELGGVCLNRGCIPTKALYSSADLIDRIRKGDELGVEISQVNPNFKKAVTHKNKVVKELVEGIEQLQEAWKNDVFRGHGKILGGNLDDGFELSIEGKEKHKIHAKRVILATGTCCANIPDFHIDHERILTSDDILKSDFDIVPKSLLIIGAGYVGCEFANIFSSFGSKVTCLEYLPHPLMTEEPNVVKKMVDFIGEKGVEIHTSLNVLSVENTKSGVKAIAVSTEVKKEDIEDAEKSEFEAEMCLISVGRTKNPKIWA